MSKKKKNDVPETGYPYPLPIEELESTIGYHFTDRTVIETALTHSSKSNELRNKGVAAECNERLEFLGDSVLSLVVSRYLYSKYTELQEGSMTKIRAAVVCEKALAKYADKISLGDYLSLGHGEEKNNSRHLPSITSDAFEALIAAMYIDSGEDLELMRKFILPFVICEIEETENSSSFIDHKTELQQIVQQVEGELLEYVLVNESGPDHNKTFEVEARLNSNVIGRGIGSTKREAEQNAAKEALVLFGSK